MKAHLLTLFLIGVGGLSLQAQGVLVGGRVLDKANQEPLPGAHVTLFQNGEEVTSTVVRPRGFFIFREVAPGSYRLRISFVGYKTVEKDLEVGEGNVRAGLFLLEESAVELGEVEVKEKAPPAVQKGDTTQFNAKAYKTNPDASAQDLLEKMPGVVVENGKVQAQGEDVQQVLVDGKPFFGNDPRAALQNLPAEVIDKIQVFDEKSEQAQFSGFDDGNTTKTINIITLAKARNGQFGNAYAGYGTDDRYRAGGNINLFNDDQRLSIIGQTNNVNQQNFATEDLLGVVGANNRRGFGGSGGFRGGGGGRGRFRRGGADINDFLVDQQNGIVTTHAFGLNYSDNWGEKMEVTGSYFFNQSNNDAVSILDREFFDNERASGQLYRESSIGESQNTNHRFNLRLDYDIDDRNSIIFRPRFTFQQNDGSESTTSETALAKSLLNQSSTDFTSDLRALDFSGFLLYRHRFEKRGRTLSLNLNAGLEDQEGDNELTAINNFFDNTNTADSVLQTSNLDGNGNNLTTTVVYTEPLSQKSSLLLNYRTSFQKEDSDQRTFDFSEATNAYDQLNAQLSNTFTTRYRTQQAGVGYNLRGDQSRLVLRAGLQWATLDNEQSFPFDSELDRDFFNIVPTAVYFTRPDRGKSLRVIYRANTTPPSVNQLQEVLDNSNPIQLSIGNEELEQTYQHNLFARYSATNAEKSTVFFALVGVRYVDDYISTNTFFTETDNPIFDEIDLQPGAQLSRPINVDGYWNLRSFLTYGLPVEALSSNLNLNLSGNYQRQPGRIDDELNFANTTTSGLGATLSSNISERVDFTIGSRSSYSIVNNSLRSDLDFNYFNQNSSVRFNWIFGPDLVFRTDLTHQYYDGLSETIDANFWLWNAELGKKLLEQRLELSLSAFDLLAQNNAVSRTISEAFVEDVQTEVLQQYFMVNVRYNLRNFRLGGE